MARLSAGERFPDAPAQLLVVPAHDALRTAVDERPSLLLRRRRARRHHVLGLAVRELEDAARELLYLSLALARLGVLVRVGA